MGAPLALLAGVAYCPAQVYTISTFLGGGPPASPVPALNQPFSPVSLATDGAGNVYFSGSESVFKLDQNGVMTLFAGNGRAGYSGDGGPATAAQLHNPVGLAADAAGNLFIADSANYRIRKVSPDGIITTVAGNGTQGQEGDGGPAVNAQLNGPNTVAVDAQGDFYIGDYHTAFIMLNVYPESSHVRKVSPSGIIDTVATDSSISGVGGLAVDSARDLYISDVGNARVLEVSANGTTTVIPGFVRPYSLALDNAGDLFVADVGLPQLGTFATVRKVSSGGAVTTVPVAITSAAGLATDAAGDLFVADVNRIVKVSGSGSVTTIAGGATILPDGSLPTVGPIDLSASGPGALALDKAGNLYFVETELNTVGRISGGVFSSVAVANTQLSRPTAIALDPSGNLYIADSGNSRIVKISPAGTMTTLQNTGTGGLTITGLAVDGAGRVFFTDALHYQIQKISPGGTLTTVAGTGTHGFSGDGGPATSAQLNSLAGLAVDPAGNLYVSDGARIRMISTSGIITTVAGNGTYGFSGDGGPATSAELAGNTGIAVDASGGLFISDAGNNRIRKVSADGIVATIAGNGQEAYSGDGGLAASAELFLPTSAAVDGNGDVYVLDSGNRAIRLLRPTTQPVLVTAVVDAASESATPVSPGRIVVIYGTGLGPSATTVAFNGIPAPILYSSATQVDAIVPYGVSGSAALLTVTSQGQTSPAFIVPVVPAAPGIFTLNETGSGQAAAVNLDGTVNTAANPVGIGSFLSLYATGEGQTSPAGVDGSLATAPLSQPLLPVVVTIGGQNAVVTYAGGAPGEVAGLFQVNVRIPVGVEPGGYVPVVLQVGNAVSQGGVTIAVKGN